MGSSLDPRSIGAARPGVTLLSRVLLAALRSSTLQMLRDIGYVGGDAGK